MLLAENSRVCTSRVEIYLQNNVQASLSCPREPTLLCFAVTPLAVRGSFLVGFPLSRGKGNILQVNPLYLPFSCKAWRIRCLCV